MRIDKILTIFPLAVIYIDRVACIQIKKVTCENEIFSISCASSFERVKIISSNYGRTQPDVCGASNHTNCVSSSTQEILDPICGGTRGCALTVLVSLFGDTCPSVPKYLEVVYDCVNETIQVPSTTLEFSTETDGLGYSSRATTTFSSKVTTSLSQSTENPVTNVPDAPATEQTAVQPMASNVDLGNDSACTCDCNSVYQYQDYMEILADPELLKQLTYNITSKLKLDKKELSSSKRRRQSVADWRPSATYVGVIGVTVLTVVFGSLIACDISNIVVSYKRHKSIEV